MVKIKRITAAVLLVILLMMTAACGKDAAGDNPETDYLGTPEKLVLWYTDSKMQPYLELVAKEYNKNNPLITVENVLVPREQYLEKLYQACTKNENAPDLYIASSDDLEEISLMGLAWENDRTDLYNADNYGEAALASATYAGKLYAYPLCYETAVMIYNSRFAKSVDSLAELEDFMSSFEHTEENASVEIIAQWDVTDLLLNYAFIGNCITIAGKDGDSGELKYLSEDFERALQRFYDIKEKLGIEKSEAGYEKCIELFTGEKLLYTIVNTNDLKTVSDSGVQYGVCAIPDYDSIYNSCAMSQTNLVVVNPYNNNESAEQYAVALTFDYVKEMLECNGLNSAKRNANGQDNKNYNDAYEVYSDTVVKSQLMKTGDTYMKLEVLLHKVWDGEAISDALNEFNNYMKLQWDIK